MEERYDAIVIGSGIGGLSAAAALARVGGKRVLVLERHFKAGGFTQTFSRKEHRWDVGLHYVGEMAPASTPRKVMDLVTGGQVQWQQLPDRFEHFSYPGFDFEVPSDPIVYEANLVRAFPHEAKAIKAYFGDIVRVGRWLDRYFAGRMTPRPIAWLLARPGASLALTRTGDYLKARFSDERLRAVVASQWGDSGLPPGRSALATHAIIVRHYFAGAWYPVGGAGEIAKAARRVIESAGGSVRVNHRVTRILLDGRRVRGVEVRCGANGREHDATFLSDVVTSAVGAEATYSRLLPALGLEEQAPRPTSRVSSVLVGYLGLKESPQKLGFRGENRWLFEGWDHDALSAGANAALEGRPTHVYLSLQTLKDPRTRTHAAQVITAVDPEAFDAWRGSAWRSRPQEYEAIKQRALEGMLSLVERRHPGFRALVDYAEVSTPLSVETVTGHSLGGIYGAAATPERFLDWRHRVTTPIKGLFLAGVDATAFGIVGGLMGGAMAGAAVLGPLGLRKVTRAAHRAAVDSYPVLSPA